MLDEFSAPDKTSSFMLKSDYTKQQFVIIHAFPVFSGSWMERFPTWGIEPTKLLQELKLSTTQDSLVRSYTLSPERHS
jgi:hypothetical protein